MSGESAPRTLRDRLRDGFEVTMLHIMRRAPLDWAPAISTRVVRRNMRRNLGTILDGARRNLALHHPELDAVALDAGVATFSDNIGRLMGEFATIDRLIDAGRVEIVGREHAEAVRANGRTIFQLLHLGNWEIIFDAVGRFAGPATLIYDPPANPLHHAIARETRARFGIEGVPPGVVAARRALKALQADTPLILAGDEAKGGIAMAPLFGRAPHLKGNLAVAARLARATGAGIVTCYVVRLGRRSRFRLTFLPRFVLPEAAGSVEDDVAILNARIEPIIRANLAQWYYLDDDMRRAP